MRVLSSALVVAGAIGAFAPASVSFAAEVRIASYGGAVNDAYRVSMWKPFEEATGIKVIEDTYNGEFAQIKAQVESGNIKWDIADPEWPEVEQGCQEGLFEKLNPADFDTADLLPNTVSECGVITILGSDVMAYNKDKIPVPPKDWAEFWDTEKFPGKRGMRRSITTTLPFALLADGVPKEDVYAVLATKEGQDRAFAKLDQLKDHIVWWSAGTEHVQGLLTGEYDLTMAYNGRIFTVNKEEGTNFGIAWASGHILNGDRWVILKGSPNKAEAIEFIKFALKAEQQAAFMRTIPYGQTNTAAMSLLTDAERAELPNTEEHLKTVLWIEPAFYLEHREALTERFENWISQ